MYTFYEQVLVWKMARGISQIGFPIRYAALESNQTGRNLDQLFSFPWLFKGVAVYYTEKGMAS
jgi:hypothetical protein